MSTVSEYQIIGFTVVPGMFSRERVVEIKRKVIQLLVEIGRFDDPSGVNVWMADQLDDAIREVVTDRGLVQVVRDLIGETPEFLSVKSVFKSAENRFPSPLHQDWFYWNGSPKLSAWIALDDATEDNGCLKIIPGTHTHVVNMVETKSGTGFKKQIRCTEVEGRRVQTVPVDAGDVIFFHDLAVHGSLENRSGGDRWSLIATYRDRSEPDESTVWSTSLPL
jgi:phytanoyl-CoA hydroxylase